MCPSLIQIGSKTAEKNSAQTNKHRQTDRQTDRHYENNGHLAVNQQRTSRELSLDVYGVRAGSVESQVSGER